MKAKQKKTTEDIQNYTNFRTNIQKFMDNHQNMGQIISLRISTRIIWIYACWNVRIHIFSRWYLLYMVLSIILISRSIKTNMVMGLYALITPIIIISDRHSLHLICFPSVFLSLLLLLLFPLLLRKLSNYTPCVNEQLSKYCNSTCAACRLILHLCIFKIAWLV